MDKTDKNKEIVAGGFPPHVCDQQKETKKPEHETDEKDKEKDKK